ncbi:MAG: SusD/RagB family nutrient-binding outer membrane lipoprotein [Flavobacteriaceae bacterium]|jgi:hypothetical protein|nr:SusD/RagB family nutrient-binding outer membrane lipoprotein [Flavobacteriaceae bacterium]
MKKYNFKKFISIGTFGVCAMFGLSSCNVDTDLNIDPKHPSEIPSANLLAMGMQQEFYYIHTGSVNFNNYRFFTQVWTETLYTQETNYNLITRAQPRNHFQRMYIFALYNFELAKNTLQEEANTDQDVYNNRWATLELSQIAVWENVVDTYGNVPYSQALQPEDIASPAYDDARTIYADLLTRIDAAIAMINTAKSGYTSGDLVYNGNMTKWKKFANSIKLRLAMNLADVDPTTSKQVAKDAIAGGVITSDADSYSLVFPGGTFSNPLYDDMVASGRNDFIPAAPFVNFMNTTDDPRRSAYFTTIGGNYVGGVYGTLNTYANFSHVNPSFHTQTAPAKLLSATEVAFLMAEAAARDNSVGDPATLYTSAVTASMNENGVSAGDASAFLITNPYNASNWQESIGMQSYVALWNSPFASWNFIRRLDYPVLPKPPSTTLDGVPVRMPYSDQEYLVNQANVEAAAVAIGGDDATTKLFWDVN